MRLRWRNHAPAGQQKPICRKAIAVTAFYFCLIVLPILTDRATGQVKVRPELVIQSGMSTTAYKVVYSPDGGIMATVTGDSTIKIWDSKSGRELRTFYGHSGKITGHIVGGGINVIRSVVFRPDQRTIASADGRDNVILLWDPSTGKEIKRFQEHDAPVQTVAFGPNGQILASGDRNGIIIARDVESGTILNTFKASVGINTISFSPNGETIVTASRQVDFWDLKSGERIKFFEWPGTPTLQDSPVHFSAFTPDGGLVVANGFFDAIVWNFQTGEIVGRFSVDPGTPEFSSLREVAISPSGTLLAILYYGGLRIWDIDGKLKLEMRNESGEGRFWAIAFSPDGKSLAAGGDFQYRPTLLETLTVDLKTLTQLPVLLRFWDLASGVELEPIRQIKAKKVLSLALSPNGRTLATAGDGGSVTLWDIYAGNPPRYFPHSFSGLMRLVFSHDAKTLANVRKPVVPITYFLNVEASEESHWSFFRSGALEVFLPEAGTAVIQEDLDLKVRKWENHEDLRTIEKYPTYTDVSKPESMSVALERNVLAGGTQDGKIKLWNLEDLNESSIAYEHASGITCVQFDGRGQFLASADREGGLKIYDVQAGKLLFEIVKPRPEREIQSISFSPDSQTLVVIDTDSVAMLWSIKSGKLLKTYQGDSYFGSFRNAAYFTPDGRTLVTTSGGNSVKFWNVASGAELAKLIGFDHMTWAVVTPDGRFDTNKDLSSIEGLHWVIPDDPMTPVPLEIFMRDYYEPGLLQRLLRCNTDDTCGTEFKPLPNIAELNRVQPKINDEGIRVIPKQGGGRVVDVEVTIESATGEYKTETGTTTLTSGVYDLRLFRNGQMVGQSTPYERREAFTRAAPELIEKNRKYYEQTKRRTNTPELEAWRTANDLSTVKDVKADGKGKYTYTFRDIKLPTEGSSEVEFAAYAFNSDRVKSGQAVKTYVVSKDVTSQRARGRAYVVTFGVNKYESPVWNLRYAANDARKMSELLTANLSKGGSFAEVVPIPLIADDENAGDGLIERRDATKANIRSVFELLAGNQPDKERLERLTSAIGAATLAKIREAMPEDAVIMSFSSHGYADQNGIFYILPTDIGSETRRTVTPELLRSSISSDELSLWLGDVDAGEMVIVVDACNADAAVRNSEFKPAPMGSRGLGQLAYDKGMQILTATQADNVAIESGGKIGHGLLNYALLKEGIEASAADFQPKDGKVLLREWLEYGETRVPKLYEELAAGTLKATGRDVIQIDIGGKDSGTVTLQRPTLFDFRKRPRGLILARIE